MNEENKQSITEELEKLHSLSMKMEEISENLFYKFHYDDIDYIKGNIESSTSDIQEAIDELEKVSCDDEDIRTDLSSEDEPSESHNDSDLDWNEVGDEDWGEYTL